MVDRGDGDRSDGTPQGAGDAPLFLRVFDALRSRPRWILHQRLRRMEARVAHRRPAGKGKVQRGDLAEPPPVLDLVLDDATDHAEVRRMLVQQCAVDPVWVLPTRSAGKSEEEETGEPREPENLVVGPGTEEDPGTGQRAASARNPREWFKKPGSRPLRQQSRPEPADTVPRGLPRDRYEARDSETDVTTDEIYDYIERFVNDGFAWKDFPPKPKRGRKPPPAPRLPRLNSLLWLRRCDLTEIRSRASGDRFEKTPEHGRLENTSQGQMAVINGLREARLDHAIRYREGLLDRAEQAGAGSDEEEPPSRGDIFGATALVHWRRIARAAAVTSRWVTRISDKATFGLADEKLLTPLAFVVSLVVTAAPFAFVGLAAQKLNDAGQLLNNIVSLLTGISLAAVYLLTVFFFFLPWRPYRWLDHHRYVTDLGEDDSGEPRGGVTGDQGRFGRHRARGVHLLNELHDPQHNKGRIGGADQPTRTRPPGPHRIAVNALLDDLHQVYGANRRRGRARATRPVLIYDQRSLGRVGRYFIRLIEDERLRRALPDPLLLVQIRDCDGEEPLVEGEIVVARHENLPEFDGTDALPPAIRRWLRERHLSGALGIRRTLTLPVAALPREWRERSWRSEPTWVMTRPVKAAAMSAGGGAVVGVLVLAGLVVIPGQVQAFHPCIDDGVWVPQGITRATDKDKDRKECYGVTFGDFVFDDRLKEVTNRIKKQNDEVDESGGSYVTIAYIGELSTANSKDPDRPDSEVSALAGVQGELLGMAYRQEKHNDPEDGRPDIKILLGNVGKDWTYSVETAKEIVDMAEDESLDTADRPIAAIGFGHSVSNNSQAIREIGGASLTMVGTTTTFDDIAQFGAYEHSEFFFPVAPSNSRIAAQAARWARKGVPFVVEGKAHGLPQSGTAVAIGNAETNEDGEAHEQYGPHLAREFMNAFVHEEGGTAWTSKEDLSTDEQIDEAVLLYQNEEIFPDYLEGLCLAHEPPDLIYFAGRSDDFSGFYDALMNSGGGKCSGGGVAILGGDDISKVLSDKEKTIGNSSNNHPVFYTPLAPSGRWGGDSRDQGFYPAIKDLECELYGEGRNLDCTNEDSSSSEEQPSLAHAAIGNDALFAITDALPVTGSTNEGSANEQGEPGRTSSPHADDDYEEKRDELYAQVKTGGFTGVSGYIAFDADNDGNWLGDRMVQLALVGPRMSVDPDATPQHQHVLQRCGLSSADSVEKEDNGEPGEECLEVVMETDEEP